MNIDKIKNIQKELSSECNQELKGHIFQKIQWNEIKINSKDEIINVLTNAFPCAFSTSCVDAISINSKLKLF